MNQTCFYSLGTKKVNSIWNHCERNQLDCPVNGVCHFIAYMQFAILTNNEAFKGYIKVL